MRIAWHGPVASDDGGAAYAGRQVLDGLRTRGAGVDCYTTMQDADVPAVPRTEGVRFCRPTPWEWDRWYSRTPLSAFVTGRAAKRVAQWALARQIPRGHSRRPYDLLHQFSQIEPFGIRGLRASPPVVVHPSLHAAGEMVCHRKENALAARSETPQRRRPAGSDLGRAESDRPRSLRARCRALGEREG
jgi:hypothetical protein